jgi:hypothetical protein
MNQQENQFLQDFLNQLVQARGIAKDPQADTLIASAVSQQPDAAYLLVQRALMAEQALNAAKAQIAALQNQLQSAQSSSGSATGFLDAANAWGSSASNAPRTVSPALMPVPGQQQFAAPSQPQYAVPNQAPARAAATPGFLSGGGSGFLGNMAATAAGVAGGALLFQGIGSMMGHHNSTGFGGQQGMAPQAAGNTTINNYYGDEASDDSDDTDDDASDDS